MRSTWIVVFILIVAISTSLAASPPKVESYRLDVTFIPEEAAMHGLAAITFDPSEPLPEELVFYLHGELEVDSIWQAGKLLKYTQEKIFFQCDYSSVATKTQLTPVSPGPDDAITIYYRGYLNPSKVNAPSNYMRVDADGVFLRSIGYSVWFPTFIESWRDSYEVDFSDVKIRTPKDFLTVFVGRQVGDSVAGDTRISHWQAMNTPIFDAQCTSQKVNTLSAGQVHVYYWDDSASIAAAEKIADFVNLVAKRFAERYMSDVSAEEYHIIEMPKYGDISSGNMSGLQVSSWRMWDQETWAQRGLAHEIIHPFVRLEVDKNDPLYAFVIESFPSFFHLPVLQGVFGDDWYAEYLRRTEERYLKYKTTGKDRRGNDLPAEKPIDRITGDEIGTYKDYFILSDRALLFFNYVRVKMGEKRFGEFCGELFSQKTLTDASFRAMVSRYIGGNEDDINIWLSGTDYPERFRLGSL